MSTPTENDQAGAEYFIADTTQAQFGDTLRVGVGNIWEEEYTAADGSQKTGLTAGLWFFVRDRPELNQHMRVHPDQQVEIAGYRITVAQIDEDGVSLLVLALPSA